MLLEILLCILILTGIILILTSSSTRVIGICLIIASIVIIAYLLYKYFNNEKLLSSKILNIPPSNKRLFDILCDKLFKKQGDETYKQYRDMKLNRTEYESDNLCKNLAKVKSNEK